METAVQIVAILEGLLTSIAAGAAIYGIGAWRRDFVGKRKIELAEEVLVLFYRAQDAIKAVRSPVGWTHESSGVVRDKSDSDERFHWKTVTAPAGYRYKENSELFAKLHALRYQFLARFGDHEPNPFDDLERQVRRIFISARMLVETADLRTAPPDVEAEGDAERRQREIERHIKWTADIWATGGEDDEIGRNVKDIVERVERICRPQIK